MGLGFNSKAEDNRHAVTSLDALRGQTMKRLAGIHQKLDSKGVSAVFTRSAKADPIGDMGFMSTLIADMVLCSPIAAFLESHHIMDAFNCAVATAGLEGVMMLTDQDVTAQRARKLSDYPEGRRKCALEAARISRKKFNLVSANQNNLFSYDVQADLACMFEILDMLDKLEGEGIRMIRLNEKESVYDVLKEVTHQMFKKKGAIRNYATPMRRAL